MPYSISNIETELYNSFRYKTQKEINIFRNIVIYSGLTFIVIIISYNYVL